MKSLWLIPVFGGIFLIGSFVSEFHDAWEDRRYAHSRLVAAWNYTKWDRVIVSATAGALFGASLAAIRLFMFN